MSWGRARAVRSVILGLVLACGVLLPSAGPLARVARQVARVVVPTQPAQAYADEPEGPHVPAGTATPPVTIGSLAPQPASTYLGPATFVPILLYHYIRINPIARDRVGFSLSTPPAAFRMQMQYLADHGFHVVSLHQAVLAIQGRGGIPSHAVVLTFDDGYADFFTQAIPALRSHGFTATDFVISGRMGWWSYMTPGQVQAADAMGFTIGAHTVDHAALAGLSAARARWEIQQSKATLEALLGHPVIDFAYPYGSYNGYDIQVGRQLGFETAVSTIPGAWHWPAQLMNLYRIKVGGGIPLAYFARLVGGPPPTAAELAGSGIAPTAPPPTPSPSAAPTPTPTAAPTPTPTPTSTPTPTPAPTPTPTPNPTPTPSPSASH